MDKEELSREEKQQRDRAKSLADGARKLLKEARSSNELDALSMATTASKEAGALIRRRFGLDVLVGAAERYRSGDVRGAVAALSGSLASALDAPVRYIEDSRERLGIEDTAVADITDRTLAALALLETEVAFEGGYDAPARLGFTRRLLGVTTAARLPARFVERWYVAVAGHLQGQFELVEAMLHVEDAVRAFPNDAEILAVTGMFYELVASPSVDLPPRLVRARVPAGTYSRSAPGQPPDRGVDTVVWASATPKEHYERLEAAKRTGWTRAEEFYRRAVGADAGQMEAHLRLGRVLLLLGRPEAALSELQVAAKTPDSRIRYLAWMFAGALQETGARFDKALACYQQALRACPQCLSASFALSHAQRRAGDWPAGIRTLDAALERDGTTPFDDYWWDYPLGAWWQRDALLGDLRGGLR